MHKHVCYVKMSQKQFVEPELNAVKNGRHSYNVEDWRS